MEVNNLTESLVLQNDPNQLKETDNVGIKVVDVVEWTAQMAPTGQRLCDEQQLQPTQSLQYQYLDINLCEFRILTINDEEDDHRMHCTLEKTSLLGPIIGRYTALSYCWGDSSITVPIVVDKCERQVRTNLEAALRQLRLRGYHRVWVDALCTNQEDQEERGSQVQIMRQIYSRADEVIVWVGSADDNTAEAVKYLLERSPSIPAVSADGNNEIGSETSADASASPETANVAWHQSNQYDASKGSPRYSRLEKAKKIWIRNQWSIIQDFFNQPFWKRVWVIQEVAVATNLMVFYGSSQIAWEHVARAIVGWKQTLMLLPTSHLSHLYAAQLLDIRNRWKVKKNPILLLEAIMMSHKSMATDPRDKIFALLGLTVDGPRLVPVPNYKLSLGEVIRDMTRAMVVAERSLDLIFIRSLHPPEDPKMPSWVPPWLTNRAFSFWSRHMTVLEDRLLSGRLRFNEIPILPTSDPGTIRVNGVLLDEIFALSSSLGHKTNPLLKGCRLEQCEYSNHWENNLMKFYPSGPTNALWQALCLEHAFHPFNNPGKFYNKLDVMKLRSCFASLWSLQGTIACSEELRDWLDENATMKIGRLTLEEWAKEGVQTDQHTTKDLNSFCNTLTAILKSSLRLVVTRIGYVSMAPPQARKGDLLCYLKGCSVPVILRGNLTAGFSVVGCCYIRIKFEPCGEACKRFAMGERPLDHEPPLGIQELRLI
jgi:hypothetical protein